MGVVYFSIIPTFEPSRYYKCWIVCFYHIPGTVTEQQRLQVLHCRQMNRDICSPSGFDVYGEPQEFFRKDMVRIGIISHFDKKQVSI